MKPRPFRKPFLRGSVWWARLPVADGSNREVSLGLREEDQAVRALESLGVCFHTDLWQRNLVYAVGRGDLTIQDFLIAQQHGRLRIVADRLENPPPPDPDLDGEVDAWQRWLAGRNRTTPGTCQKYLMQVRRLVEPGVRFPASAFSQKTISRFLTGLNLAAPNRYRAALSSFATFLIETEVIQSNPLWKITGAKEADPRVRYLERREAQRLISLLDSGEAQAIHALMCGSGIEIGAALAVRHRDIEAKDRKVHAHGTKRTARDRVIRVTEPWCWDILAPYLAAQAALPAAPVFTLGYYAVRSALGRALKAAEIEDYTSHDWRHTYAVQGLRDRRPAQVIAHQLGHQNTAMVQKVYGRYVPNDADYEQIVDGSLTNRLTDASEAPNWRPALAVAR